MKRAGFIMLVCTLLFSGCSHFQQKPDVVITEKTVKVDPRILESCLPLATIDVANPQYYDILNNIEENVKIYADCATKQENSIKVIKEFANIKK